MTYEVFNHRLHKDGKPVPYQASPNHGGVIAPVFIVEHHTAGWPDGKGSISWLCNPDAGASAHTVIDYWGNVTQLVDFNIKAWHAGASSSSYNGMPPNDHSIGHELANPGRLVDIGGGKYQQDGGTIVIDSAQYPIEWFEADWDRGFYIPFSAAQLETNAQINQALKAAYPDINDITTHQICDPTRKVDPHPGFDLAAMQAASGIGAGTPPETVSVGSGTTINDVVWVYQWDSYKTPLKALAPKQTFLINRMKTSTNDVDGYQDTRVWYCVSLDRTTEGWIREGDITVATA